jgi:glycosyltransferase involved in cell wall biosynthesis
VRQRRAAEGILAGRVTIRPFAQYNELPSLYGLAQALILPSIVDQWGLVINEAMASGIPVLASNRCGAAEDLVLEEATGRLFDPHSRRQITQAMLWMTSKTGREVKALGTKARNHIAAWSPDCFADSFHRAATSALQRRPSRWTDAAVLKMLARMVRDPMAQRAPQSS